MPAAFVIVALRFLIPLGIVISPWARKAILLARLESLDLLATGTSVPL